MKEFLSGSFGVVWLGRRERRENLLEWVHFYPFEDSVNCVRIFSSYPSGLVERICLYNDETAGLIGEWACHNDPSLSAERFQAGQVRRSMDLAFCLAFRPIKAENDEFHALPTAYR